MTSFSGNALRMSLVATVQMRACFIKCLVFFFFYEKITARSAKQATTVYVIFLHLLKHAND